MLFQLRNTILFLLFVFVFSCQTNTPQMHAVNLNSQLSTLDSLSCEKLIEKSADQNFSLKALAGLKAHKNCKNFKYDFSQLTELEKKIFADEVDELDPQKPPSLGSLSLAELKENLSNADTIEQKFKIYKQIRAKQKNSGQRNDYLKTTADLFNLTAKDWKKNKKDEASIARFYEASQLLIRSFWTEDKIPKAQQISKDCLRLLKGLTSVAELYYINGRMNEEKNQFEEAVQQYDLALLDLKETNPKTLSFTADRILWLKSWILYKNKNYEEAEKSFAELARNTTDTSERSKAFFYQARCLNQLDKKEEAKAVLEGLIKLDSFTFYGLVAHNELGIKFPAISQVQQTLQAEKKFNFDPELLFLTEVERNLFKDLIRFKEINIAERSIAILAKSPEKTVNLGIYLAQNGKRYLPLFAGFAKLDNSNKLEVLAQYPDLLFPRPYVENVKLMSEKTQLPSSLIYSIMKQESAFNEKTRSHADAMGLMQMIPRLAQRISKKFDVTYTQPDDLYNPEINIQLGSFELMEQVKKQSGQMTYVAAAYNAGPNALAGWLKTRKRNDVVEFIEEIPYDETRTYVKIIARNKLFYDRISKRDEEQSFPIEFLTQPLSE